MNLFKLLIPATLLLGATACGDDEVSLRTDGMPLIVESCGGCHTRNNSPAPAAVTNMVYLEQPGDITGLVGSFITAGDSANSGFIKILRQEMDVGMGPTPMPPPPTPAMATADVDLIAKWVDEGAKDN